MEQLRMEFLESSSDLGLKETSSTLLCSDGENQSTDSEQNDQDLYNSFMWVKAKRSENVSFQIFENLKENNDSFSNQKDRETQIELNQQIRTASLKSIAAQKQRNILGKTKQISSKNIQNQHHNKFKMKAPAKVKLTRKLDQIPEAD